MVPQIRLFLACFLLTTSAASFGQNAQPVIVATVTETEVNSGLRVVGTVRPARQVTIGSAVDGRVKDFLVNEGDAVKAQQPLAQLRTKTLEIQQAAAAAEVELARQKLAELKNGSLPEEIAEAEARMRSAAATVKLTETNLKRQLSLSSSRAGSKAELDAVREEAEAAKFSLKATEALYKKIKDGPRPETIAQAEAQLELQTQKLNLIVDQIQKFTIIAPFDGYVSLEHTEVGAWISRGDPIVDVIELKEVEVDAPVPAEAVVNLRRGDAIRVEFPELPDQLLTGTIDRIVPIAESRARTFPVRVRMTNQIHNGRPLLLAGMLARLDLPAGRRETLPLVPKDALVLNGSDRSVYVVDVNESDATTGTARKVSVKLGVAVGDRIQVLGNLHEGEFVVVTGNERLQPNSTVKMIPAAVKAEDDS